MKIAFDEHIPPGLVGAFLALEGDAGMLRSEIVSARGYAIPKAASDVPWLERFAADGGKVVISGDIRMRGKLHEQKALSDAGFIVIFLGRRWGRANGYNKSAMLMRWWPYILDAIASAKPGQFFEVPFQWRGAELREVTPPAGKRKKPGPKRKPKTANRSEQTTTRTR